MADESRLFSTLSARQQRLLCLLSETDAPVTMQSLAQALCACVRTVRRDLDTIEMLLPAPCLLVRKPGTGVYLQCDTKTRVGLRCLALSIPCSSEARKCFLLRSLLNARPGTLTLTSLAQKVYVSRSSLHNDLLSLTDFLDSFHLALRTHKRKGVWLTGSESDFRNALHALFYRQCGDTRSSSPWDAARYAAFFPDPCPVTALQLIRRSLPSDLPVHKQELLNLHVLVWLTRVLHGFVLPPTNQAHTCLQTSQTLCDAIGQAYGCTFPPQEQFYLSTLLISAGVEGADLQAQRHALMNRADFGAFLTELLRTVEPILNIRLTDPALLANMSAHLSGAICRMQYGIRLQNPLLSEIKASYPAVYSATWSASFLFEKHFHLQVTEAEIGFLALYIGMADKSQRAQLRACIVCNYGIGVSGLLQQSIQRAVPGVLISDVLSMAQFLCQQSHTQWDLIFSTVDLPPGQTPVMHIGSILSQQDVREIQSEVHALFRQKALRPPPATQEALLQPDFIHLHLRVSDKREALWSLCRQLQSCGRVAPGYFESVLAREAITSTEVGTGIAIPHGDPSLVQRPIIAVARCQPPLHWSQRAEDTSIEFIFLLALSMRDEGEILQARAFYQALALLLETPALRRQLSLCTTASALCALLLPTSSQQEVSHPCN